MWCLETGLSAAGPPQSYFAPVSRRWAEMGLQESLVPRCSSEMHDCRAAELCSLHQPPPPSLVLPVHVITLFKVEQLQCKRVKVAYPRITLREAGCSPVQAETWHSSPWWQMDPAGTWMSVCANGQGPLPITQSLPVPRA